jgi:hypothetical protein
MTEFQSKGVRTVETSKGMNNNIDQNKYRQVIDEEVIIQTENRQK